MRRIKFLSAFVLLAALVTASTGAVMGQEPPPQDGVCAVGSCKASTAFPAKLSAKPMSDWLRYEDPDYGFALEYPAEWKVETTIQQSVPFSDPSAIIKRQTFIGPEGLIDLDVWLSKGHDLDKWLDWYGATRNKLPITHPNASIAGQPAVVFVEEGGTVDMLTAFFSDGRYVYRLWYTVTQNKRGVQAYWHMLDTFILPGEGEMITAQIPDDVRQSAQRAVESSATPGILVASCCGYYSDYNPFPCCIAGNCTWWVFYKYGWVPFRYDAWKWWGQVPDYPEWSRSGGLPRRYQENIAWWNRSGAPDDLGHVAYIANYTGGGRIYTSEMACGSLGCAYTKDRSVSEPSGYIFEEHPPQP